jgi:RNA polymerase sigma-70 factor, ECF subfamily
MTVRGNAQLTTLDDSFLIRQTLSGNKNAFRFLVLRYQRPIFKYLTSFGLPQPVIEELAQETFVRAFKSLDSYHSEKGASFSTWLFLIAKRLAINETSKASRKYETATADGRTPEFPDQAEEQTPQTLLESKQSQEAVREALDQVPTHYRRALVLSQIAEHSLEEIARIENCSVGAVKSRIHRGKEILRAILLRKLEAL